MVRNLVAAVIFIFIIIMVLPADVSVSEAVDRLGATFQWEPYRKTGMLSRGDHIFVFKPGLDVGIFDYSQLIPTGGSIRDEHGGIVFSDALILQLAGLFEDIGNERPVVSTVIIDPGHGGKDPGAIGRLAGGGTIMEKDVVLETCRYIYSLLSARYPGKNIIMTRYDDTYPELEERTELANSIHLKPNEAMIFISVHANASFNTKASGYEVWYLPPEYRRDLIDPEDMNDVEKDVIPILNTMLEEEYTVESIILARSILREMDTQVGSYTNNRGAKEESWFVVRNARMPSVLIEMGFITNTEEAGYLSDSEYLKKAGRGIYNGIRDFIDTFERTGGFTE